MNKAIKHDDAEGQQTSVFTTPAADTLHIDAGRTEKYQRKHSHSAPTRHSSMCLYEKLYTGNNGRHMGPQNNR